MRQILSLPVLVHPVLMSCVEQCLSADTIVLSHAQPSTSDVSYSVLPQTRQELLEKPSNKADNIRMLLDLNGAVCEVVTGVALGALFTALVVQILIKVAVYPILTSPGYAIKHVSLFYFKFSLLNVLQKHRRALSRLFCRQS